ncbi:MAG: prepilin peptidase [Firmicutes bacterium]|nr:prepilin peptidase [Bacillota bacterium]
MEFEVFYHWFFTFWSFVYGLMIGSFLNVCIYRMPPKLYIFDDITYKEESDFTYYLNRLLYFLRLKKEEKKPLIIPSLYAEGIIGVTISPESITHAAIAHNFNLFRQFYPDPVNIVKPRSFCPHCRNMIRWWMNIPVLSWIILGGKCYFCKEKISPRYLLIELFTGLVFGGLFYLHGMADVGTFLLYATLSSLCIVVFFVDLEHWIIMDEITLPFSALAVIASLFIPYSSYMPYPGIFSLIEWNQVIPAGIYNWFMNLVQTSPHWLHPDSFVQSLTGAIIGFASFWAIGVIGTVVLKREAMGGGDVKFAMLMGAFLGTMKAGLAFFIAVVIGTLILLPLLLINKKTGKDQVPFGCFLALATMIVIFLGDKIMWFYFNWPDMVFGR